jgi:predicted NUDIX family NTP pyrophosphohydrolase
MRKESAGLLMFRRRAGELELLLAHPGGPFWSRKDLGAWTIPKGEIGPDEEPLVAARREFREETGLDASGEFIPLGAVRQSGAKIVHAWAFEGDFDVSMVRSNLFEMPWPPKSGKMQSFPEIDRAEWFSVEMARKKILKGQVEIISRLLSRLTEGIK